MVYQVNHEIDDHAWYDARYDPTHELTIIISPMSLNKYVNHVHFIHVIL